MINTLLGVKMGMTSSYDARQRRVGATMIEVTPNFITQIKSVDTKDGYNAVQIGSGTKKSVKKSQIGQAKKAGIDQKIRWFREVKTEDSDVKSGQEVKLSQVFSIGDSVKVTGVSKGKGFAGVVKRHGFAGGPKTHGQSDRHRAPGSIGQTTTPGRVYKGKRMAGHMGAETASVRNLEVVGIDRQNNLLVVKGGIPGPVGSLVIIKKLGRIKGYIAPPEEKADEDEVEQVLSETKEPLTTEDQKNEQPSNEKQENEIEEVKENA